MSIRREPKPSELVLEEDRLPDPCSDRVVNTVPLPPNKRLAYDRVFLKDTITNERAYSPNIELIKNYQYDGGLIDK